ncbi:hypothetical protein E8E11_000248 [Didymella keratinophila]|nr:hypothetical protein E8E11_000248 [Didymella keratinophila]
MRTTTLLPFLQAAVVAQYINPWNGFDIPDELPPLTSIGRRQQSSEPCGQIAESLAAQNTSQSPSVSAQLAYECLQSVPVDVEGDVLQIQQLKEYLQFQSTLAYLKTGSEGQIESYDILGQLDVLAEGVGNGTFESEYDVQLSIRKLLDGAGDFHLFRYADITRIFQIPALHLLVQSISSFKASPVISVNGKNASQYVETYSSVGNPYHDVDARYNVALDNPARRAYYNGTIAQFSTGYIYDGGTTTLTFANGSVANTRNVAFVGTQYNFTNVTDGTSFFDTFCRGLPAPTVPAPEDPVPTESQEPIETTEVNTATPTATSLPVPTLVGYPKPEVIANSKVVAGYILDSNYSNVAVLVFPSMDTKLNFSDGQEAVRSFLHTSVQQGKKKLVVDLRGNGEPYGGARYRAHEAFQDYSAALADVAANQTTQSDEDDVSDGGTSTSFLWSNILDANQEPYTSFKDYYGPDELQNDTFTSVRRYNFSRTPGGHPSPVNLTGYGVIPASTQPFMAENIVIVQDGLCGSTCAIFAELMREQGKVQTIAIGGRPMTGPMQGVGRSKGSQVLNFAVLLSAANDTVNINAALESGRTFDSSTAVGRLLMADQVVTRVARGDASAPLLGSVNSLNNLREGDETNTPLEFVYVAADCKLFYTRETWSDPRAMWKRVVDVQWRGGKCVDGSTGDSTAIGVIDQKGKNTTSPGKNNTVPPIQSNLGATLDSGTNSLVFVVAVTVLSLMLCGATSLERRHIQRRWKTPKTAKKHFDDQARNGGNDRSSVAAAASPKSMHR